MRCQEIALENKLPYVQLVESAGANLLTYQVERFIAAAGFCTIWRACRRPGCR